MKLVVIVLYLAEWVCIPTIIRKFNKPFDNLIFLNYLFVCVICIIFFNVVIVCVCMFNLTPDFVAVYGSDSLKRLGFKVMSINDAGAFGSLS